MNIAIFSPHYLPHLGGVEQYTYNLAKALKAKGHCVTVVTSRLKEQQEAEVLDDISIYRVPCISLLNGRFPIMKPFGEWKKIQLVLKEWKPDYVVVNTRFYPHSYFAVRFARQAHIPALIIEHGTAHFTVNNAVLDQFGHIYEHGITNLIKHNCSSFYGVSEACNTWLQHFKIKAKGVLYNAVDFENIKALATTSVIDYKKEYNLSKDVKIVAYTGRLVKEKGVMKLAEAVRLLEKQYPDLYLLIAGSGELESSVKGLHDPHVILMGKIDFPHVVALLTESTIFCLPTDYPEGFPTSVLEAAAAKCFIITTTAGGSKELINSPAGGIVLSDNTVENIKSSIEQAITDDQYRRSAVSITYTRLLQKFTWDKTSSALLDIILEGKNDGKN